MAKSFAIFPRRVLLLEEVDLKMVLLLSARIYIMNFLCNIFFGGHKLHTQEGDISMLNIMFTLCSKLIR